MHQNCVYKLWYSKNRNSWKEKHLQKRKGRRGGLPAKPVAGSDRSLDSDALQSASVGHRFFTSSFLGEDNSETYSVHQNLCMWSLCGKLRSTNKSKGKEEAKNREEIITIFCESTPSILKYMTIRILKQFIYLRTGGSIYITKERIISITQYIGGTHNTRTLIPMNTRTQTLLLWASSKTVPANPQNWRSHHRRLARER
jgi:hypothetical protein